MSAQLAVERATGSKVTHLETVPVVETFRGQTIWEGVVEVFAVGSPPPEKAYGWAVAYPEGPQYIAVLGKPPIETALDAVRAWLVSEARKGPLTFASPEVKNDFEQQQGKLPE